MDHIGKAVERARSDGTAVPLNQHPSQGAFHSSAARPAAISGRDVTLNAQHLEANRIIAHDLSDRRSRSFDMLRTQILQSMDQKGWQFLGITSPTEGCGKSVVAINLALSIARQPDRSVLLIDLDLQKPQISNYLGVTSEPGIVGVLSGRVALHDALVQARIKNEQVLVLPCEAATQNSSAWIASREMTSFLNEIKRDFYNWTVIFDLPPILSSDDVLTMLPRLDCVAFVVGAGMTTTEQIKECNRHFESTEVVRVVLNKSEDTAPTYYDLYGHAGAQGAGKRPDAARVQPAAADRSRSEDARWDKPPEAARSRPATRRNPPTFRRLSRMINRLGRP